MNNSQKIQVKHKIRIKHNKCKVCGWDVERDNWKVCNDCISCAESTGNYEFIRKWGK